MDLAHRYAANRSALPAFAHRIAVACALLSTSTASSWAGTATMSWRGVDLRITPPASSTASTSRQVGAPTGISESEVSERIDATALLMLRAVAAGIAHRGDDLAVLCPSIAGLSPMLYLSPIRPDTIVRPPIEALSAMRLAQLPVPSLAPAAAALGGRLNDCVLRANLLLGLLNGPCTATVWNARFGDLLVSLSALQAQREEFERHEPVRVDSLTPLTASPSLNDRLAGLSPLERQLLLDAGLTAPEIEDLNAWLQSGHLRFDVPLAASSDPLTYVQTLLTSIAGHSSVGLVEPRGAVRPNPARLSDRGVLQVRAQTAIADAEVIDARGRRVRRLAADIGNGSRALFWDARDEDGREVSPGVYFIRLRASHYQDVLRVVLIP